MRFAALDGWRGLFAIVVVLGHFPAFLVFENPAFISAGSVLIEMFFVLSGFVICAGYEAKFADGYDPRRFLIERLGRIYPIHLAMLLVFVFFELFLTLVAHGLGINDRQPFTADRSIFSIFTNLLLIQSFNIHDTITWNFPAWSLSTEWACYILFAGAMIWRPGKTWPFALAGVILAPVALYYASPHPMQSTYDFGVLRAVYGFSLGVLGQHVYRHIIQRKLELHGGKAVYSAVEIAAVLLTFALPLMAGPTRWQLLIPPFYAVVIVLLALQRGIVSDFLKSRPLAYLGTISLSIYICHIFFMLRLVNVAEIIQRLTGWTLIELSYFDGGTAKFLSLPSVALYPLTLGFVVFIIFFSHLAHRYVELPGDRWVRQKSKQLFSANEKEKATLAVAGHLTK